MVFRNNSVEEIDESLECFSRKEQGSSKVLAGNNTSQKRRSYRRSLYTPYLDVVHGNHLDYPSS
jgi:hypothetical protein